MIERLSAGNQAVLAGMSDTEDFVMCPSCLEMLAPAELVSLGCSHGFCDKCTQTFVTACAPLPVCPTGSCRAVVREEVVEKVLGDVGLEGFREALLQHALQQMPGRVACPNPSCGGLVVCEGRERQRITCPCGSTPFCSSCRQPYHYHHDCSTVQSLREQWVVWLESGLETYVGLHAGFKDFLTERSASMEIASQRHRELADDERYKAERCRLCPHCYRPVERVDGCNSMRCGENYHGGAQQSGCGKNFDWSRAPRYQAAVQERSLPTVDIGAALLSGAGCCHLFTRCALCTDIVRGPRFRCIHCESFDVCLGCVKSFASTTAASHPKDHVFEILYTPAEPPIEDMPRGTSVSVFGLEGAGAALNGCSAKVFRYSPAAGLYELSLPNGSRPVVSKEHVQPDVKDPADAQTALELALGQQEVKRGFYLGIPVGCMVRVPGYVVGTDDGAFQPVAEVKFYDPNAAEYCIQLEEPLQWACGRCTLFNDANVRRCTACGTATSSSDGRFRIAVEMVEPLVRSAEQVKRIVQRHWKENQRLQEVCIESSQIGETREFDHYKFPELHSEGLLRGIYSYGFQKPTDFQQISIEPILAGRDVLGIEKNGTGKTTACLIGVLGRINYDIKQCQGIILTPTRELAYNLEKVALALGEFLNIKCSTVSSPSPSLIDKLRDGQHLVVGTPGRVFDMISRGHLKLDSLIAFLVDDMDEVLARGFKDQVCDIFTLLGRNVQRCLFSATLPPELHDFAAQFLREEVRPHLKPQEPLTLNFVRQFYVAIEKEEWKLDTLCDLHETIEATQSIVYCNTRRKVDWLTEQLRRRDFAVSTIHCTLDDRQRKSVLSDFRTGSSDILICEDIGGNVGIRAQDVSYVVNYDLPQNVENYLHRVGQKGRCRYNGVAINFVTNADVKAVKDIEKYYHTRIEEMPMDIVDLIEAVPPGELEVRHYVESDPRDV